MKDLSLSQLKKINDKVAKLKGIPIDWSETYNWAEDRNYAIDLLEEFGEEVSIQKNKGIWYFHHNKWDTYHEIFSTAICLAYIKWKSKKK